jgi:hypothetical protein
MEEDKKREESHAKAQRRGGIIFAPLRLCVRFSGSVSFVLLFALFVRCGALWLTANALREDRDDYRRLAANLVEHGTFGTRNVPTAFRPPLYPLALTGCVAFGDHARAAVGVLHVLLGVATVGLVLLLGRWWGLGRGGAALAALLVACDPILLASSSLVMTETLAAFLATAGLLALTWAGRHGTTTAIAGSQRLPEGARTGGRSPGAVGSRQFFPQMVAGIVLALAALCRPAFLLWTLAAAVMLWWRALAKRSISNDNSRGPTARGRIAAGFRAPAAFVLGALIVLSPWAIRNQLQFGRPIITTTHGGYTLLLANNPEFYDWLRHGSWGSVWQADEFNYKWDLRCPRDELQADRQAYAEAWQTIRARPGMFLYACAVRVGRFWSPLPHCVTADETAARRLSRYAVALWYLAEFLLAMLGIWRLSASARRSRSSGASSPSSAWHWGLLLIVCLLAGHVVYWTDMRMRAPIMPVVAIIAAAGLPCCRPRGE